MSLPKLVDKKIFLSVDCSTISLLMLTPCKTVKGKISSNILIEYINSSAAMFSSFYLMMTVQMPLLLRAKTHYDGFPSL